MREGGREGEGEREGGGREGGRDVHVQFIVFNLKLPVVIPVLYVHNVY